jgi:hypothetical protein
VNVRLGAVASGHGDIELRISPHPVLGHVEACGLHLRLGADPPERLQHEEDAERRQEGESADRDQAERLDSELVC